MNDEDTRELVDLFESAIDRSADEKAKRRLAALLRDNPEAQAKYVEHCQMHAMLAWEHGTLPQVAFNEDLSVTNLLIKQTVLPSESVFSQGGSSQ